MNGPSRTPTSFETRVYGALREIPKGRVVTYSVLAAHLECRSAQAVGQALKRNPLAPEVPCHRVIKTNLTLGGYDGKVKGVRVVRKRRREGREVRCLPIYPLRFPQMPRYRAT